MKKRIWMIPLVLIAVIVIGFIVYTAAYYPAENVASSALLSDDTVKVKQVDTGWFFDGPSEDTALIFYPGAKVEETAYAPLLHQLAQNGMDVFLVKMPFRLATLSPYRAEAVRKAYDYDKWYISGHSLGGCCAAMEAAKYPAEFDGIIFLAAYPDNDLGDDLDTLFIYGSEDTVLNHERYTAYKSNAPDTAQEYVIEGGNHAQFGSYGKQQNDGDADITPEEQIRQTVEQITAFVEETA